VTSAGVGHGRVLLVSTSAVRRPDLERRLVSVTLADQAAAALASSALAASGPARSTDEHTASNGTPGP
jgi:hypothetical protein